MIAWLKREMVEVGLVTLYFLACFLLAVTLMRLVLAQHQIEFVVGQSAIAASGHIGM